MRARLHHNKFSLGNGLELVRRHKRALYHLERLTALLALTDGAGQHCPAPQRRGERLRCLALRCKAAEDGVLAVVAHDFCAFFSVILLQLGEALDDGH